MKKFFSILAAVLFAGSMMATEVTFTKDDFAGQGTANTGSEVSATKDGVTFTFSKGYCADESLRCYAHGALSITAEATIEKINFTTTGGKTGGLDAEVTVGATSYSVDDLASQARFTEIKVTLEGGAPVVADTYTVAGSDAAIFGEAWNPALAANDMTLADGVYTWTKAELNLAVGSIEFKVVKNHSWDIAYPAQNYVVNIAEAGEYTLTITFDPTTEAVAAEAVKKVIPQYEVAEAIAAGLAENDEILVRGVITKMEFKGKNFAKYGSVNIYVADATGAEGAFEFYNCYSLNADTFRTSDPAYDAESTAWVEYDEVADENGNAIHVGDTVIAFGKYKLYNETYELNTGCYLTEIKHPGDAPVEHTYTVAGDNVDLFGTAWTPANEDNDMVLVEGLYTWEKTEQTLPVGNVAFKVCEDHAWTNCWPAQNYVLAIPEAGIYTITITFDPANDNAVNAVATKTGDAVVVPTVAMHGNFLGSWADTENFTVAEGDATASLTLTLAAGNYEFGMRIGGSGNWTANGAAFTRENNSAEVVAGQGNLTLAADVAGEYLFTWTFADNSLTITYPDAPVVVDTIVIDIESGVEYIDYVAQSGWWQFMYEDAEYSISISNSYTTQAAGVYTVADLDQDYTYIEIKATETEVHFVEGSLTLTEGEDGSRTIEGVMTGDDGNIYNIKLVYRIPTAETTVNVEIPEWGIYDGSEYYGFASYVFAGEAADSTYVQIVIPGTDPVGQFTYDDVYAGGTGIEVGGEYKAIYSMNITINVSDAGRAIITADILCYNNTLYRVTTPVGEGIDAIEAAQKIVKMIQNGQFIIEKNGVRYNANGQIVR